MADSKKTKTTIKPKGLSIKRDGMKFNCSWKIADSDYGGGQEFQFQLIHRKLVTNTKTKKKEWDNVGTGWIPVTIGKTTTAKSIYKGMPGVTKTLWFNPTGLSTPYLHSIKFRVRGLRKEVKENGKTKQKFTWSNWVDETLEIKIPENPKVSVTPSDSKYSQTNFAWSFTDNKTTVKIPSCVEYQSLMFQDFTWSFSNSTQLKKLNNIFNWVFGTDSNKPSSNAKVYQNAHYINDTYGGEIGYAVWGISKKSNNTITGRVNREEDSYLFSPTNYSWTRVVRIRTWGPRGCDDWLYKQKTYAKSLQAKKVHASISSNAADGTTCSATWESDSPANHPIDYTTIQYAMAVPTNANLEPASDISWTDGCTNGDSGRSDGANFDIDLQLGEDQCFYVRVNNIFDKRSPKDTTTFGKPTSVTNGVGVLKDPILKNVSLPAPGSSSRLATVTASNESETASFGFLGVYYRKDTASSASLLGIIKTNSSGADGSTTVMLPDSYSSSQPGDFGVRAFVGDYTRNQDPSKGTYSASTDTTMSPNKVYYFYVDSDREIRVHKYIRVHPSFSSASEAALLVLTAGPLIYKAIHEGTYDPSSATYPLYENSAPYTYGISGQKMKSSSIIWGGDLPLPPSNLEVSAFNSSSSIAEISWVKNWQDSDGTEISWADHEDAWISTDAPSTTDVLDYQGNMWHISGLSPTKYWFRARNYIKSEGENIYGPYSETVWLKLASAPSVPVLTLSDNIIPETGNTTCYWVYVTNDGTPQSGASIADVTYILSTDTTANLSKSYYTYSEDTSAYTRVTPESTDNPASKGWYEVSHKTIASVSTEYSYTLLPDQQTPPWTNGETHYLSVSYVSGSGEPSGWSEPVKLNIAELPHVEFTTHTFELNKQIVVDSDTGETGYVDTALTTLPLEFIVTGDDSDGIIDVHIERDGNYDMRRPDAIDDNAVTTGFDKEIVAKVQAKAGELTSIKYEDLIGQLDDSAKYVLKASVKDKFGQINSAEIPFIVYWNHQANYPDATIQIRDDYRVAIITPTYSFGPSGATGATGSTGTSDLSVYELSGDVEQIDGKTYYYKLPNGIYYEVTNRSGYALTSDDIYDEEKTYYYVYYSTELEQDAYGIFEYGELTDNPASKGWYEVAFDEYGSMTGYVLSEDVTVQTDKNYYEQRATGPDEVGYWTVIFGANNVNPQSLFLYEQKLLSPIQEEWYELIEYHDTCDIYRLSADAPELIIKGAEFGTAYVDKYPVIGSFGGYRLVYRTYTGDYITAENEIAWKEFDSDDGVILDLWDLIIDWDGKSVSLPYNVSVNNSWSKDFVETKYLGGSVQGDWNPAISRTGSVSTVALVELEPETIKLIRDLANYPGICHVRTPDGSSYSADVQVSENREERWVGQLASVDLNITRVDSQTLDGITKDEWDREIAAEES